MPAKTGVLAPRNIHARAGGGSAPLVSVVLPVYNGAQYVVESLESVLRQTYDPLEIVVVDDHSTDPTPDLLAPYAAEGRIVLLQNDRNLGQFGAVNTGIAAAHGELIAIQHADDVQLPTLIAREVEALSEHPEAGAAFALDVFIDAQGRPRGRVELPSQFAGGGPFRYEEILDGVLRFGNTFLRAPTFLARRSILDEVGPFSEAWGLRGDIEMWLRIARLYPVVIVDEHLTSYRWGHENESKRYERLRVEPELTFALLDELLDAGDRQRATTGALAAFEARRAEDLLIVTANRYVRGDRAAARASLALASPRRLAASGHVRRPRLLVLWAVLALATRLPRIELLAREFFRRWGQGR